MPNHINPRVLDIIKNIFAPNWVDLMRAPYLFNKVINIFILAFSLGLILPFFRVIIFILRTRVGAIVSALGILWSNELQGYTILKDYACFIIDSIESHTSIRIPTWNNVSPIQLPQAEAKKTINKLPSTNIEILDIVQDSNKWLSILGLVVLGLVGIVAVLCVSDMVIPEASVPVIGELGHTINSSITSFFSNIIDYFRSKPSEPGTGTSGIIPEVKTEIVAPTSALVTPTRAMLDLPQGLSRANSWDSSQTVRPFTPAQVDPAKISEALGNSRLAGGDNTFS